MPMSMPLVLLLIRFFSITGEPPQQRIESTTLTPLLQPEIILLETREFPPQETPPPVMVLFDTTDEPPAFTSPMIVLFETKLPAVTVPVMVLFETIEPPVTLPVITLFKLRTSHQKLQH